MKNLTSQQELLQARRLHLEEQMWTSQVYLCDVKRECEEQGHVVIPGRIMFSPRQNEIVNTHEGHPPKDDCYSVSCAICGVELGWYCPVNPKGYCEYEDSEDCIHCHQPSERK